MNIRTDEEGVNSVLPCVSVRAFAYTWVMCKRNDGGLVGLVCLMTPKDLPSPEPMHRNKLQLWPLVCGNTLWS